MLTESELPFIRSVLIDPPNQRVEEVSSQSLETRRIPDTYIYKLLNGKFCTPSGIIVEGKIEKSTYLGKAEFAAFEQIQRWADQKDEGFCVWFSPPYPEVYPVSKFIIQEITDYENTKLVVNRAVVLDNNTTELISIAEDLLHGQIVNPETLRATPIFPEKEKFMAWFGKLALYTNQIEMINNGVDLQVKVGTYSELSDIERSISVVGEDSFSNHLYHAAYERGLIGNATESCPTALQTAFNVIYGDSLVINTGESKYVENCGSCGVVIKAVIPKGYICTSCGGEYKGC